MSETLDVAIIGGGPAGISAGMRAAFYDMSHVVLDRAHSWEGIFDWQIDDALKCEPEVYPFPRSDLDFDPSDGTGALANWRAKALERNVQIEFSADVVIGARNDWLVDCPDGAHCITLSDGRLVKARSIVLAIGNTPFSIELDIAGCRGPNISYKHRDLLSPGNETVVVIGSGEVAAWTVYFLSEKVSAAGRVVHVCFAWEPGQLSEFCRRAMESGPAHNRRVERISGFRVQKISGNILHLRSDDGEIRGIVFDKIQVRQGRHEPIARLIKHSAFKSSWLPADNRLRGLSRYRTELPNVFAIGSVTGRAGIIPALNDGFDVVEYIQGNENLSDIYRFYDNIGQQ